MAKTPNNSGRDFPENEGGDGGGMAERPISFDAKRSYGGPARPPKLPDEDLSSPEDVDPYEDGLVGRGNVASAFTEADAKTRTGNYIIPFGLPGSGKTTMLASLFKYIDESPLLNSEIVIPERKKVPNYAGQAMLNDWQRIFNSGRFLGATEVGDLGIRELTYKVQPNKGQRTTLDFSVIEVSGEDLVKVIADTGRDPKLPGAIATLFTNPRVRPVIVLVVHPNQLENDLLFNNLHAWLRRNVKARMSSFSLAVVIANPDLALSRLHNRRPDTAGQDTLGGKMSMVYLQEFAPKTYAIFNGWEKSKRAISPFYVGDIKSTETQDEVLERIVRFEDRNASQIFAWAYHQFTGRKLGRTRIQQWVKKLGG
jgi:hypothetical protein